MKDTFPQKNKKTKSILNHKNRENINHENNKDNEKNFSQQSSQYTSPNFNRESILSMKSNSLSPVTNLFDKLCHETPDGMTHCFFFKTHLLLFSFENKNI